MARSHKELVGASTAVLVLGVLAGGPEYGYQIVRRINEAADGLLEWQEGTIYPVLHKLEREQLVRAQWQASESGRERKYYYVTAQGRAALAQDVRQWRGFAALVLRVAGAST